MGGRDHSCEVCGLGGLNSAFIGECECPPSADDPKRDREGEMCEAAYRCESCDRPWIVFAVHGEPTDGVDDPRKCRFCEDGIGRRIR